MFHQTLHPQNKSGNIEGSFMEKLEETLITMAAWQDKYGPLIDDIHLLLHGNGNPEKGFIIRLISVERFIAFGTRLGWLSGGAVVTGMIAWGLSQVL